MSLGREEDLTFRERQDGIVNACSLSSGLYFTVPSCDTAIADIVGNGVIEEDSVLGHNSNVRPERDLGHLRPKKPKMPCPVRALQASRKHQE